MQTPQKQRLAPTKSQMLDLNFEWKNGELVTRHPRVRIYSKDGEKRTIHRRNFHTNESTRLNSLLWNIPQSNLIAVTPEFYACQYIEGSCLDEITFETSLIDPIVDALVPIWNTSQETNWHFPDANREKLIAEPLTYDQLLSTPNEVIRISREFAPTIKTAKSICKESQAQDVLIHGDLKVDNLIITPENKILAIDWECCGMGKLEEDLGSFISSLMFFASLRASQDALTNAACADYPLAFQAQLSRTMKELQNTLQELNTKLAIKNIIPDFLHLSATVFLSLVCRIQGAILAGSSPTSTAVLHSILNTLSGVGIEKFALWLGGKDEH